MQAAPPPSVRSMIDLLGRRHGHARGSDAYLPVQLAEDSSLSVEHDAREIERHRPVGNVRRFR